MHPRFLDEAFSKICTKLLEVFIKKHKDYGKDNILEGGELGIIYRISDKISRLKNLKQKNRKPQNEAIDDNWIDIAVYSVIAILYRKGYFQKLKLSSKALK